MDRGWHFVGATLLDGLPVPPDGVWLIHNGPLVMCESGLHYSRDPFDALQYAPGNILCRVEVDGEQYHNDKGVAARRRIIERSDATAMLRAFACAQALTVAHLWNMPGEVRRYIDGTDRSEAAREAAWEAARQAAWEAAFQAAWEAARQAARDAAWEAAFQAAWEAARGAAREAAWAAARQAAREAAWAAAREAARAAARADFSARVAKLLREEADRD